MSDAEKAVLSGLSADAKAALKALLKEVIDKDIPAIVAVEETKLPAVYQGLVAMGFSALYPEIAKMLDAKVDAL